MKNLFWDLGNVIALFERQRVAQNFRAKGIPRSVEEIDALLHHSEKGLDLHERLERGMITPEQYRERTSVLIGCPPGFDERSFWECHNGMFTLNQPVISLAKDVRASHPDVRHMALSDCDLMRLRHLLDLSGVVFDRLVTSFRIGHWKPHDEMFIAAKRAAECEPAKCFYVDDRKINVDAGTYHGFVTHWYDLDDPERNSKLEAAVRSFLASP